MSESGARGATRPSAAPVGWYPDPGGLAQWRRWDGATWSDATMPYGPPPPDTWALARARAAWLRLRPIAAWAIGAPALFAVTIAAQTSTFAVLRKWFHDYLRAAAHHRPTPLFPSASATSTPLAITIANYAVFIMVLFGLIAWMQFSSSAVRVAAGAAYPRRHSPFAASVAILVPLAGPFFAWSASRDCLPSGHEARWALGVGWTLVCLGELASFAVFLTVLSTASALAAWVVAGVTGAMWIGAAVALPIGLGAIADDHESLGVRLGAASS